MQVGDRVRIKEPFSTSFSGVYEVIALAEAADTYTLNVWGDGVGSDFHISYLEAA